MGTQPSPWEIDRQVVLTHLQNVILALRSNATFAVKVRSGNAVQPREHPLMQMAFDLQNKLLSYDGLRPSASSSHEDGVVNPPRHAFDGAWFKQIMDGDDPSHISDSALGGLTESDILSPFCSICTSVETTEVITSVALLGLASIFSAPCSFVSVDGLKTAITAAAATRSEIADAATHEVLLSRIIGVYVACIQHPLSAQLSEEMYVALARRMLVVSCQPAVSPLLKRTAENAMNTLVTMLYKVVITNAPRCSSAATTTGSIAQLSDAAALRGATAAHATDGTLMMRFMSSLINGEITALDFEGNAVDLKESRSKTPARSESGVAVLKGGMAIQLEGLWLAQYALLAIMRDIGTVLGAPLLSAIQNDLSRALLIAGVGTSHVVVLSQVLRTVHLVVQCAGDRLVPQTLSFIRVLHLSPLATLTEKLTSMEETPNGGVLAPKSGGDGGSPLGSPQRGAGSPTSGASPTSTYNGFLYFSSSQLLEMHERKEVLLESLAEFCSNPTFCAFCYAHYDLSWRHTSVLPQLFDVLLSNASARAEDAEGAGVWRDPHKRVASASARSSRYPTKREGGSAPHGGKIPKEQLTALRALYAITQNIASFAAVSGASVTPQSEHPHHALLQRIEASVQNALRQKQLLSQFALHFIESPLKSGIAFLLENACRVPRCEELRVMKERHTWLVIAEPAGGREIGECLFRLSTVLDKRILGDYIGDLGRESAAPAEGETVEVDGATVSALARWEEDRATDHLRPGSVRFFEEQLKGFVHQFDFSGKSLITSIREMVFRLCLPGESQKIDRIMETFAAHWYAQNKSSSCEKINPFHSEGGAFILSFAMIMLNTDLHSGKLLKSMHPEDFVRMNRGIDDGKDLPAEYLQSIYDDIKQHEIIMAEMMDRGFANNVTWNLEMNGHDQTSDLMRSSVLSQLTLGDYHCSENDHLDAAEPITVSSPLVARCAPDEARLLVRQCLDAYVFRIMWKHCLLAFRSAMLFAECQLSHIALTKPSLAASLHDAYTAMPSDLEAFCVSCHGISTLAKTASALQIDLVADECLTTFLSRIPLDLSQPDTSLDLVRQSVAQLLYLREVFLVLPSVAKSLRASWPHMANCLFHLYLLGALATSKTSSTPGEEHLLETLTANPGFASIGSEEYFRRITQKNASEGGWFAALWSGGSSGSNSAALLQERKKAYTEAEAAATRRLRDCVPDIVGVLDILQKIDDRGARFALVAALCDMESLQQISFRTAVLSSYALTLIAGIAARTPSDPDVVQSFVTHARVTLSGVFAPVDKVFVRDESPKSAIDAAYAGEMIERQKIICVARRHVDGVLYFAAALLSCRTAADCAGTLHELFELLISSSSAVFNHVVVDPFSAFLLRWASGLADGEVRGGAEAALPSETFMSSAAGVQDLIALSAAVAKRTNAQTSPDVMARLHTVVLTASHHRLYNIERSMTAMVDAVVAIGLSTSARDAAHPESPLTSYTMRVDEAYEAHHSATGEEGSSRADDKLKPAEILAECCRAVVRKKLDTSAASFDTSTSWHELWITPLKGLCILIANAATTRDGGEALLCLQRSLLDAELRDLPASAVLSVYDVVLLPLVDRLCAPGTKLTPVARRGSSSPQNDVVRATSPASTPPPAEKSLVVSLLSSLAPPPPSPSRQRLGTPARSDGTLITSSEVKSRVINLLPKVLLRYTSSTLRASPEILQGLWQRVLGTLYALYTAYPDTHEELSANDDDSTAISGEAPRDAAACVREAVEETVKNMIYVVAASPGSASPSEASAALPIPYFWTSTRNLIRPFSFSPPLLAFMDSMDAPENS